MKGVHLSTFFLMIFHFYEKSGGGDVLVGVPTTSIVGFQMSRRLHFENFE
jgi:hypothetical protein